MRFSSLRTLCRQIRTEIKTSVFVVAVVLALGASVTATSGAFGRSLNASGNQQVCLSRMRMAWKSLRAPFLRDQKNVANPGETISVVTPSSNPPAEDINRSNRTLWQVTRSFQDAFSNREISEKYLDPTRWVGKSVLDAGCGGKCQAVRELAEQGVTNVIGVDREIDPAGWAGQEDHVVQALLSDTGLPSESFDIIFSSFSVFTHNTFIYKTNPTYDLKSDTVFVESLREMTRLLKPGGIIILAPIHTPPAILQGVVEMFPGLSVREMRIGEYSHEGKTIYSGGVILEKQK